MRRTKAEAQLTRTRLLRTATQVFGRLGYAATRLEDIAAAAGLTRGALYHHFAGKAELFAVIVQEATALGDRAIQSAIEAGGDFLTVVQRILVVTLELLQNDAQYHDANALLLLHAWDSPELEVVRSQHLSQGLADLTQIEAYFHTAWEQGIIRRELDPTVAARAYSAYQNGLVLLSLLSPGLLHPESQAQSLAEVFVRGIASPEWLKKLD